MASDERGGLSLLTITARSSRCQHQLGAETHRLFGRSHPAVVILPAELDGM
jgi:hypothetical protein